MVRFYLFMAVGLALTLMALVCDHLAVYNGIAMAFPGTNMRVSYALFLEPVASIIVLYAIYTMTGHPVLWTAFFVAIIGVLVLETVDPSISYAAWNASLRFTAGFL